MLWSELKQLKVGTRIKWTVMPCATGTIVRSEKDEIAVRWDDRKTDLVYRERTHGPSLQYFEVIDVVADVAAVPELNKLVMVKLAMRSFKVPRHLVEAQINDEGNDRADGGCVCDRCGLHYRDHPTVEGLEYLNVTCAWKVVKL